MLKLTVIGNPIAHSLSPWVHGEFAKQAGLDVSYTKTESPLDGFQSIILQLRADGYHGANVTAPFKEEAYRLADVRSRRADIARAANILTFLPDGSIYADNADGEGLVTDIQKNHNYSLKGKKILILGAGGGVRGILHPLLHACENEITLANRTESKAKIVADEFMSYGRVIQVSLSAIGSHYEVIIDCTGMDAWPLPINDAVYQHATMVYDLKYHQQLTPILEKASLYDVSYRLNGLGMLIVQAAVAFAHWTGFVPDTAKVRNAAHADFDPLIRVARPSGTR